MVNVDDLSVPHVARFEVQSILFARSVLLKTLGVETISYRLKCELASTLVLEEFLHHVELCVSKQVLINDHVDQELNEHIHVANFL